MILIIDNFDSFTYNLVQLAASIRDDVRVVRNNAITVNQIAEFAPSHIILSPGPGHPKDAGICEELVAKLCPKIPMLGVCLGHQAICEAFGATITQARRLMHGKTSEINIDCASPLFKELPPVINAARYHSLAALRESLPDELAVIAQDAAGEVMAVKHSRFSLFGLQFHPESFLTPMGGAIMKNFLEV